MERLHEVKIAVSKDLLEHQHINYFMYVLFIATLKLCQQSCGSVCRLKDIVFSIWPLTERLPTPAINYSLCEWNLKTLAVFCFTERILEKCKRPLRCHCYSGFGVPAGHLNAAGSGAVNF